MKLKMTLTTLDGLDDSIKALYRKNGDKYVLNVEGGTDAATPEDVEGLKSALNKEREARKSAEKKASDAAGAGEGENKRLRLAMEDRLRESVVLAAIAEAHGNARLLLPHLKDRTTVVQEEGEFIVRVVDESGQVQENPDTGLPLTVEDLVLIFKEDKDFALAFTGSLGGGATSGAGGFAKPMTLAEKSANALKNRDVFGAIAFKNRLYSLNK